MNTVSTSTVSRQYNIEGGPNIDTLIDAFKYAYDPVVKVPVTFVVAKSYTCPPGEPGCAYTPLEIRDIRIVSLAHESGSGVSLNIEENSMPP